MLVGGRYEPVRRLGEGGSGEVVLARDTLREGADVAVKMFARSGNDSEAAASSRLRRELRALARLRHPGIVDFREAGFDAASGRHFLVLEYVPGERSLLDAATGASPEDLFELLTRIAAALEFIHRRGYVHGDLKPGNVRVRPDGRPVLLDLGLSRPTASRAGSAPSGTLPYIAPEVLRGGPPGPKSDLYALGVILFQVLHGRLPFDGADEAAVIRAHLAPERPDASRDAPARHDWLVPSVQRLIALEPSGRPARARELVVGWAGALGVPVPAEDAAAFVAELPLAGRASRLDAVSGPLEARLGDGSEDPETANRGRSASGSIVSLVCLEGEEGAGKTRLLREIRLSARLAGAAAGSSVADRAAAGAGLPWARLLSDLEPTVRDSDGTARRMFRDALAGFGPEPHRSGDPGAGTLETLCVGALRAAARRSPLIVAIDDFQHADALTSRLLETACRELESERVLFVVCLGPGSGSAGGGAGGAVEGVEALRAVEALEREGRAARVPLPRLEPADLGELLEAALGSDDAPRAFVSSLHRVTRGNPLFVATTLEALARSGALSIEQAAWRYPEPAEIERASPDGLDAALARRLDGLETTDRETARTLALLGDSFPAPVARSCLAADPGRFDDLVERLSRAGVVLPPAETSGRILFAHGRIAELLRSEIPPERLEGLHAAAARAWKSSSDEGRLEALARHAAAAGDRKTASAALRAAADRALALQLPAEAASSLSALGDLLADDPAARAAVDVDRAACLLETGDLDGAIATLERLEESGDVDESLRPRLLARKARALVLRHPGRPEGLWTAQRASSLALERGDPETAIAALKDAAVGLARSGRTREARPVFERALQMIESHPDPTAHADVLNNLALTHLHLGDAGEAERLLHLSQAIAFRSSLKRPLATSFHNLSLVHRRKSRPEAAVESAGSAARLFGELGNRLHTGNSWGMVAFANRDLGRYAASLAAFESAEREFRRAGDIGRSAHMLDGMGEVLRACGRARKAEEKHREALALAEADGDLVQQAHALAGLARDKLELGERAGAARSLAERAVLTADRAGSVHARSVASLALASEDLTTGRYGPALSSARRILEQEESESGRTEIRLEAEVLRARALSAAGRSSEAFDPLEAAIETAAGRGDPDAVARACHVLASVAEDHGRTHAAQASARRAASLVRSIREQVGDEALASDYAAVPWRAGLLAGSETGDGGPIAEAPAERRLEALYDIVAAINSLEEPRAVLEKVVDTAVALVGAERGLLILLDDRGADESGGAVALDVKIARGLEKETIEDATDYSRSVVRDAAGQGRAILAVDAGQDSRFRDFRSVSRYNIRSLMCVPLRHRSQILGTVYVDSRRAGPCFTEEDLRFLEAFAHHAAIAIENARRHESLLRENELLRKTAREKSSFGNLIGRSAPMQALFALLEKAAASDLPVLIQGESGTGKELVARALHFSGRRSSETFVAQNCSAIPETLLESELFGHARGAFSGAETDHTGLFVQADGGTLFLDEIVDLPLNMQPKLLRVIEDGAIRPLGSQKTSSVDVRIVAATNREPEELVAAGTFRQDLFYRLNVLRILMPPLRERREDIPLLVDHFLEKISEERSVPRLHVDRSLLSILARHDWPGNVRELENVVARLTVMSAGDRLSREDLESDPGLTRAFGTALERGPVGSLRQTEREQILRALQQTMGNRAKAARMLGISRATIFRKIREFGL